MVNPLNIVVNKLQKVTVVIDAANPSDSNIKNKEHNKLEKCQGLKGEIEKLWRVKASEAPVVI